MNVELTGGQFIRLADELARIHQETDADAYEVHVSDGKIGVTARYQVGLEATDDDVQDAVTFDDRAVTIGDADSRSNGGMTK